MGSVENRNELKNFLEMASLAGDKLLDEESLTNAGPKNSQYKRANPLVRADLPQDETQ